MDDSRAAVHDFLELPYCDRQFIAFVDDKVFDARAPEKQAPEIKAKRTETAKWVRQAGAIAGAASVFSPAVLLAALAATGLVWAYDAYSSARSKGVEVRFVPRSWAKRLRLLPGHPRERIVYAGHPVTSDIYMPLSDFHRFTFEHKFKELLSILMHLGATRITVRHVVGWGREFSGKLSVSLPDVGGLSAGPQGKSSKKEKATILYEADLAGTTKPRLPKNLIWYHHENTWQQVAEGRLKFGLKTFALQLQYNDDFGINAGLKGKLEGAGFDIGGKFERQVATVWEVSGAFYVAE